MELSEEASRHLLGAMQNNGLELLRKIPDLKVHARGNLLSLNGSLDRIKKVKRFVQALEKRLAAGDELNLQEFRFLFGKYLANDSLPEDPFKEVFLTHSGRSIRPKTFNQEKFVRTIIGNDVTIALGPAGTGKTYLSVALAVKALREKQVNRVILSRPTIESGEKLGFLPGDMLEKVDPYFRPLYDAMHDFLGISRFQQLLRQGVIEITPLGFMRGRTFNEAFIVVDEAQNISALQMKMLLTRLGYNSKMVISGDHTQIDLPNPVDSSLKTLKDIIGKVEGVGFVTLMNSDVVRHELVRRIIGAYDAYLEKKELSGD